MEGKSPLTSKTLWINALAIIGSFVVYYGVGDIDATKWGEVSVGMLGFINVVLRFVTHEPIDWGN